MRGAFWLFLAAHLATAACQPRTGVLLTIEGDRIVADQLRLTAHFDNRSVVRLTPEARSRTPLKFPVDLFADFNGQSRTVVFSVEALLAEETMSEVELQPIELVPGEIVSVRASLGSSPPSPATSPDLGVSPDAGSPDLRRSYAAVVLADSPLAYYRLNELTGNTAFDASGRGLHGTYGVLVTRGTAGLLAGESDGSVTFGGGGWSLDKIVTVPRNPSLEPTSAVSIEAWMSQPIVNRNGARLIDYGGSLTSSQPPFGAITFNRALGSLLLTQQGPGGAADFLTQTEPAVNRSYHFVQTYDGVHITLYLDGVREAQKPFSGSIVGYGSSGLGIGGPALAAPQDLVVFTGTLDEVAIYGVALTPQQVLAHYAAGSGR